MSRRELQKRRLKQKLSGLLLVIISLVTIPINEYDATAALFLVPLGLYLIFTKEQWVD
jgi:hypothetical protein